MPLSAKVFYDKKETDGTSTREIRRFSLEPEEVATTFELLTKKIRQAFPSVVDHELNLQWKGEFSGHPLVMLDNNISMCITFFAIFNFMQLHNPCNVVYTYKLYIKSIIQNHIQLLSTKL